MRVVVLCGHRLRIPVSWSTWTFDGWRYRIVGGLVETWRPRRGWLYSSGRVEG
jgi:hypothetical protein